jgi:hypothetical protein
MHAGDVEIAQRMAGLAALSSVSGTSRSSGAMRDAIHARLPMRRSWPVLVRQRIQPSQ